MIDELIVVALPIGNVGDLSARAQRTLQSVSGIFTEDTRKFRDFARWAGLTISAELKSFDAHIERDSDIKKIFSGLQGRWALVSDAGTPAINDPGSQVVRSARKLGIKVTALPGPSALSLALQWSGAFGNPVTFLGFVPKKTKADFFEAHRSARTLVFFESKHNVLHTLATLADSKFRDAQLICLREMTKEHEEYFEGRVADHQKYFEKLLAKDQVGELTFVLEAPGATETAAPIDVKSLVEFRNSGPSQAAKILAKISGISRDQAFEFLEQKSKK